MMRVFLTTVLVLYAMTANAQDIGPVRPDVTLQSPTQIQALSTFVMDGTWNNCLILDGADHLVIANHFECKPITEVSGITVDHLVIVTADGGDVVVRGLTVNAAGVPSEPSSNKKTVWSIPFAPTLISDSSLEPGTGDIG